MGTLNSNIVICSFDFKDEGLINHTLDLLNYGSKRHKHTRAYWDWRFEENPFGPSLGWYAKDLVNSKLAGVLLWWPWKYNINNSNVLFYQAINGKTAPEYRNIGIFYELNRVAINYFTERNIPLYGVPNSQSYPSYVKLQWFTLTAVQPYYFLVSPFKTLIKLLTKRQKVTFNSQLFDLSGINIKKQNFPANVLYTEWDKNTLHWRFCKHPLFSYYYFSINGKLIIFKIKDRNKLLEAQVVFCSFNKYSEIRKFTNFLNEQRVDLISYFGYNTECLRLFKRRILRYKLKKSLYFVINDRRYSAPVNFSLELAETDTQ